MTSRKYSFKLYVAGRNPRSEAAVQLIEEICRRYFDDDCALTVIDILENPEEAKANKIVATPTLLREAPPPQIRIVGDMNNIHEMLSALGIDEEPQDDDET